MKKRGLKIDAQTLRSITSLFAMLVALPGCFVPRAEGDQMLVDLSRLRSELAATQRDQGDAMHLLEARVKKLEEGNFKQNADRSLEKEKLLTQVEQLKTELEELKTVGEQPAQKSFNRTDQVAAIKTAYESKEYERAIAGSDAFLAKYADDKQFGAQVLYWRADSYAELGEHKKAVLSFQELLTKHQNFSKIPEALYKVAVSLDSLKFPKDAVVFYEEVIQKHPKSSFAAKAKEQLKKRKK